MTFGKILKSKRLQKRWTQEELSEKLLISRPTISSWESDKTLPDISNLLKMSVLFGCTLDELLKEELKLTTKIFKTMTYGTTAPLRIKNKILNKDLSFKNPNPEVKANVNMETGEVTFFIEQEELKKLNK
ncbi:MULTISPECIES: helix-turn-helix domain-containing protein [Vagococcus]|uniref:helix-turn-helix domain-containing protein n=1 Tax=Vagococcus TaxID=2737 RepID=UPI000E5378A1|nr:MULTISPECIES: helix-turn-helix transcriptional regulator [Vagococcus]RHH66397.1 XRE family transcriptional regulator [Vagococcus sp. AM17-17]